MPQNKFTYKDGGTMSEIFLRTEKVIGSENLQKLKRSKILMFGAGGVGGFCAEALARAGIGALTIVDNDTIAESNINRQIIALHSTIGKFKTDVIKNRLEDINPDIEAISKKCFFSADTANKFNFTQYDYIIDAIDTITSKLLIIELAAIADVPVISCMGAGNKLDPTKFQVDDIYKTSVCPLARVMRTELRKRGIKKLKVVYSTEPPLKQNFKEIICKPANFYKENFESHTIENSSQKKEPRKKDVPGSISFVPSVAGLILAGEVIKDICGIN